MKFCKQHEKAITPVRAHKFDAGTDLFAIEEVILRPGEVRRYCTGIHVAMKDGETALYWEKSGRALVGLQILGGCLDGPYRGELSVVVANTNLRPTLDLMMFMFRCAPIGHDDSATLTELQDAVDKSVIRVPYGKALTQFLHLKGVQFEEMEEVTLEEFDADQTERGASGFGSTDMTLFPRADFHRGNGILPDRWEIPGGFYVPTFMMKQALADLLKNPDKIDGIREGVIRSVVQQQTSPELFNEELVQKVLSGFEPLFRSCTIIDGPFGVVKQRIVPKESWYFRGHRFTRVGDTLNYRYAPPASR